jgi:DDE superfamily endonuclease/Helix-turn-helix of DDE superfamily endonuclease
MTVFEYLEKHPDRMRHLFGIPRERFEELVEYLQHPEQSWNKGKRERVGLRASGGGAKSKLSIAEQVSLCLLILRQGVSQEVAGLLYGLSTTQVNTLFHLWLPRIREGLPSSLREEREKLGQEITSEECGEALVVDSWEQPRQRPSKHSIQKKYYSGKKGQHTFKGQLMTPNDRHEIVELIPSVRGPRSDIGLFREQKKPYGEGQVFLGDKAYVGDKQIKTPTKKPKGGELSEFQKLKNKVLSSQRIIVEHVIRRIKTFRIASERFRLNPVHHSEVVHVVCALVRLRIGTLNLKEFAKQKWG